MATAKGNPDWEHVWCAATLAGNTSMRGVEIKNLRRKHVDLVTQELRIGRSKTEGSKRRLPLNADALDAMTLMIARADKAGHTDPDHFLWCACENYQFDPTKAITTWRTAWRSLVKAAGLPGLRFHDLRHTVITRLHIHCDDLEMWDQRPNHSGRLPTLERLSKAVDENHRRALPGDLISDPNAVRIKELVLRDLGRTQPTRGTRDARTDRGSPYRTDRTATSQ
jgi:integrase